MQHQQLQQLLRRAKQKNGKYYLGHEETTGRDSGGTEEFDREGREQ